MRRNVKFIVLLLVISGVVSLLSFTSGKPNANENVNNSELAAKLVNDCAQIKEGDIVSVSGGLKDAELLEDIAVEVRKLGAFPLLRFGSDRYNRKSILEVPEKYDTQTPKLALELAQLFTATISIDYNEDFTLLHDIDPNRLSTLRKTYLPIDKVYQDRNARRVFLGNNLYPNDSRAKQFGVSKEDLAKVFWSGVNVDYKELEKVAVILSNSLAKSEELHIISDNGTDFKVKIKNREISSSDGVISNSDISKGGSATTVWLPAGEVYLTPVPGTAEGTIVDDFYFFGDKEIKNLVLTFEKGNLVDMKAESGMEYLKPYYDAGTDGKEVFSAINFGINKNMSLIPNSKMECYMAAGMISLSTGYNVWAGGDNNSTTGIFCLMPNCTVKLDGTTVISKGDFRL